MIDYEVKIFNAVHPAVAPLCADSRFVSRQVVAPTALPAASLVEISNVTDRNRRSSAWKEDYAIIAYQLDVFAKTKSECRKVFSAADEKLTWLGFNRTTGSYLGNASNVDVFRYTARYEAVIDRDGVIYRRR